MTKIICRAALLVTTLALLAGCVVAPGYGYYRPGIGVGVPVFGYGYHQDGGYRHWR